MTTEMATDREIVEQLKLAAERFTTRAAAGDTFATGKAEICLDIARKVERYGSFASARQRGYALALIQWANTERVTATAVRQQAAADANTDLRTALMSQMSCAPRMMLRIAQLFEAAATNNLQRPRIRLRRGEWNVRIYPAPSWGRHPGAFYIRAGSGNTGRLSLYCGRIIPTGDFLPSDEVPLDVLEVLRDFSADPAGVAAAYGHACGSCCFCGHELTDARSVAMGYGPVCAQRYGLEWGEQRAQPDPEERISVSELSTENADRLAAQRRHVQEQARVHREERSRARTWQEREAARRLQRRQQHDEPVAPEVDESDEDSHFM